MDPYESLFDIADQTPINFGSPTLMAEEHSHLQTTPPGQNPGENCYMDDDFEHSSCAGDQISRNQKLLDFDENETPYFDQNIVKEEELSNFLGQAPAQPGLQDGTYLENMRMSRLEHSQVYPPNNADLEDRKEQQAKGIFIICDKLQGEKYSLNEVVKSCRYCYRSKEIHNECTKPDCCTKKRCIKEDAKYALSAMQEGVKGYPQSQLVGLLSIEERSVKVNRYLEKKRRRKWNKKINYHSRKKVADTRPRFKGRFVSVDQADEFNRRLKEELQEKLRKERMFVTQKVDKTSGTILKTVYPNIEALNYDMEHLNTSDNDSHKSCYNLKHNNELMTYIGEIPLEM